MVQRQHQLPLLLLWLLLHLLRVLLRVLLRLLLRVLLWMALLQLLRLLWMLLRPGGTHNDNAAHTRTTYRNRMSAVSVVGIWCSSPLCVWRATDRKAPTHGR